MFDVLKERIKRVFMVIKSLGEGLDLLLIRHGYMEMLDMENVLKSKQIDEKTIFYGQEEIITKNPVWMIFGAIKDLSPSFVHFYKFPHQKLLGVVRRAEL